MDKRAITCEMWVNCGDIGPCNSLCAAYTLTLNVKMVRAASQGFVKVRTHRYDYLEPHIPQGVFRPSTTCAQRLCNVFYIVKSKQADNKIT